MSPGGKEKPSVIGHYVLDGVTLGKGNFARVELATHTLVDCQVAIKMISKRRLGEGSGRARLAREAKLHRQMHHPNIARLYESLKVGKFYCLVMEYVPGGDLTQHVKSRPERRLTESQARSIFRQLVSAVDFMHAKRVVHRDLKSDNVLLDEDKKEVKIIDLGLSNTWSEESPLSTQCGSAEYAAPELFLGDNSHYGPEVDLWSLGILLYFMVVGQVPFLSPCTLLSSGQDSDGQLFGGRDEGLTSTRHCRHMTHMTPDLVFLLHQLVCPDPDGRLTMAGLAYDPWITCQGRKPLTQFRPLPRYRNEKIMVVNRLAPLVDQDPLQVDVVVSEYGTDRLSAMFNLLFDQQRHLIVPVRADLTNSRGYRRAAARLREAVKSLTDFYESGALEEMVADTAFQAEGSGCPECEDIFQSDYPPSAQTAQSGDGGQCRGEYGWHGTSPEPQHDGPVSTSRSVLRRVGKLWRHVTLTRLRWSTACFRTHSGSSHDYNDNERNVI